MFMVKKILHLYKLPHHHTFLIPEADHIESGGEVRHVETDDRLMALAREHHYAGEDGDSQETLRVFLIIYNFFYKIPDFHHIAPSL